MAYDGENLVSVIIPCFNHGHLVSEAIESVLAQSYGNHEIVLVDDGSTDNTAGNVAGFPGVRYVRQENQGLAAARNTGARESTGEYLVFLDADDLLLPDALQIGLNTLRSNPDCAFVAGWCKWMTADGTPLETPERVWSGKEDFYHKLLTCNNMGGIMAVMFRRSAFDSVGGFDPTLRSAEDYEFYLRLTRKYPVYCHDQPVAEYRRRSDSLSQNPAAMLQSTLSVLRAQRPFIKGNRLYESAYRTGVKYWQNCYGERLIAQVRRHARAGEWKEALSGMWILLRLHPRGFFENAQRKLRVAFGGRSPDGSLHP